MGQTRRYKHMKLGASDEFQTPPIALAPLLQFLPEEWVIWECACGYCNLVAGLQSCGYRVIGTDIQKDPGRDFLEWQPKKWDCIVTNPPFSQKNEFLRRAFELDKPFAFLLPYTTLESVERQRMFREHYIEILMFDKRISFETPSGNGSSSWFGTAWFTYKLNLGQQLKFVEADW